MARDRGLEGPAGPGAIEIPSGLTPLELRASEEARRHMVEHLGNRPVLRMDDLAELKDARPRLEKEIRLPSDKRGSKNRIFFFSIDGTLRGNRFSGCLLAGECIMVQETSFERANRIAKDGLRDTLEIAHEYLVEASKPVLAKPMDAVIVEAGGRAHHALPGQPELASDPKLKAMLQHLIGKKPWAG